MIPWWGDPARAATTAASNATLLDRLDRISRLLQFIIERNRIMAGELDTLAAQVTSTVGVEQSALALIQGLHDRLVSAGTDPAALQKLADDLKASSDQLAAAVAANALPQ